LVAISLITLAYLAQVGYLLAYVMTLICFYIIAISFMSLSLRLAETVILKLLEYDRGLVLGAAGLLGALGAVLKF
jgi:hypothetical protein